MIGLKVIGDPVPWAAKTSNPKTGTRFVPARQSAHAGRIIDAWTRDAQTPEGVVAFPKGTALRLECVFYVRRPQGHFGTGRNAGVVKPRFVGARPTGRPDLSNLVKMVEDALTSLAWADDDQIVEIWALKVYTERVDDPPRSEVTIRLDAP